MRISVFILHLLFPIILGSASYLTIFLTTPELDPIVHLPQGSVRGLATEISKELSIESFQGIRYAHAPIGKRRWRRPLGVWEKDDAESHLPLSERALSITQNRTGSDGVFDAQYWGPSCLQFVPPSFFSYRPPMPERGLPQKIVSEDCLNVNVWRPKGVKGPLPVMVFIFGGAYVMGADFTTDPTELIKASVKAEKPVIFVSLNYRLGAMGFLSGPVIEEEAKHGRADLNVALHDQRVALRWIQRNIGFFGGDSEKVTIVGESAGGISIAYQMLADGGGKLKDAPNGKEDLYRGAIMQSGGTSSAIVHPSANRHAHYYDTFIRGTLCSPKANATEQLDCLRNLPELVLKQANVRAISYIIGITSLRAFRTPAFFPFWPVIDGEFIEESPLQRWQDGKYKDIPFISGNNLDEGTRFVPHDLHTVSELSQLLSSTLISSDSLTESEKASIYSKVLTSYPDDPTIGSPYNPSLSGDNTTFRFFGETSQFKRASSALGDLFFQHPRRASLLAHAEHQQKGSKKNHAWSYQLSESKPGSPSYYGVAHGADLDYVFGKAGSDFVFSRPPQDYFIKGNKWDKVKDQMMGSWIQFVSEGKVGGKDSVVDWEPYTTDSPQSFEFKSHKPSMIKDDFRPEMEIWNDPEVREAVGF